MKANGGCVSPRNALDSVDFAVSSNRKQKGGGGGPVMTSANRNSKNNRLRQKESLLYNRSRSGGAASGPVSGIVPKRSKLPDEADWGVAPRRNSATTRIGSNKNTYEKTSLRDEAHQLQTQRPRTPNRIIKQHMENAPRSSEGGPLAKMTPIEHLRNERRQKPLSTTRTIALTRARTTEVTPKIRPRSQGRSRRELEKAQRKPQVTAMADVTSRHRNHPQHSSQREYGVDATRSPIFQSTRVSPPLSAYPDGPTLFEEAKKEQVRKERRRSQLVDEALRIRDQQEDNSIEESMLDYYDSRDPVEEDCWDAPHRVPGKAALDPVEQFRDTIELDYNEAVQKETIHIPGVREKPRVKTVTNWGITQIFSDLSCTSTGPSNLSKNSPPPALAPSNPTPFASSLTSASQTLQQALAAAKSQIYPSSFGNSRNAKPTDLPVRVLSQEPKPTATTVEIGYRHKLQDDSTTSEIRPTEPQNTIQSSDNTSKQTGRGTSIPAKLPTPQRGPTAPTAHVKTQSPRPQRPEVNHRRQKIKSQSNFIGQAIDNQAIQKEMRPSVSSTPLSRPKSPDTMRMLETTRHFPRTQQGENRRSRSKTPEGLRNRQQNLGQKARPRTPDRFARPATPDDLKSRKSTTPLRDRLLRGGDTRSASTSGSGDHQSNDASSYQRPLTPTFPFLRSRSRSLTPSRDRLREPASTGVSTISSRQEQEKLRSVTPDRHLISQRRQRTPGQVLGDTRQFADRAEERLSAIQQKRETEEKLIAIQKELSGEGHGDYQHHIDSVGTERSLSQLRGKEMERKERKSSVKRFFGVLGGKSDKKRNSGQSPRNMGTSATLGLLRGDSTGARGRGVGPAGSSVLGSSGGKNANLPPGRQSSQQIAPESPREPLSMRWFGRKHYEVPHVAAFETDSTSTGAVRASHLRMQHRIVESYDARQDFSRGSSQELLKEDASHSVASSRQHSMRSDNVLAHMTTFDSLMKTIESEKEKAVPEAEFAVVELGDEDNVIWTDTIMMNPNQVEGQLVARGLKKDIQRYSHLSKKKSDINEKTPTIGNMRPAHDDSDLHELEVTQSFANQLQGLQQLQKPPYQYNVPRGM